MEDGRFPPDTRASWTRKVVFKLRLGNLLKLKFNIDIKVGEVIKAVTITDDVTDIKA